MAIQNENEFKPEQAVRIAGLIHKNREKEPMTEEEQLELDEWLSSQPSNAALLASLNDRENIHAELEALNTYDENSAVTEIFKQLGQKPPSAIQRSRLIVRQWSVAASVLLIVSVASWLLIFREPSDNGSISGSRNAVLTLANGQQVLLDTLRTRDLGIQGAAALAQQQGGRLAYTDKGTGTAVHNTLTTPKGVRYSLQLADGSEVWLNAGSTITYPTSFAGNTRDVTITGEAYFSVAKDKTKPFFVTAGGMKVEVVGTAFNVMAYSDEEATRTTLAEGIVKASNTENEIELKPGEQAILVHQSGALRSEKANIDAVTAWRKGEFIYHETEMAVIMRQLARWYDVKVEYRGSIAGIAFSGKLPQKQRVKELLDILSDTRKIHFEIKDDSTIVIIPGPR